MRRTGRNVVDQLSPADLQLASGFQRIRLSFQTDKTMSWSKLPSFPVWLFAAAIGLSLISISYATAQEESSEPAATEELVVTETSEVVVEAPAEAGLSFEDETTCTVNTLIIP